MAKWVKLITSTCEIRLYKQLSFPESCSENGIHWHGYDFLKGALESTGPENCHQLCWENSKCNFWIHSTELSLKWNCWLKRRKSAAVSNKKGIISGPKNCTGTYPILKKDSYLSLYITQKFSWHVIEVYFPTEFKDKRILLDLNKIEHPSSNHVTFNLAEHLPKQLNSSAPRFRISEMKVLLMDKNENILYHGSTFSTNDVVVQITFPKIFSDHTIYGKKIHFGVSKAYHCQSAYFNKSMKSHSLTNFF